MKIIQKGILFLSLFMAGLCQAADTEDLVNASKSRYNSSSIFQEIKDSSLDSYAKDDLLIDRTLCSSIQEGNSTIVQLIEAKINEINELMKQEQSKFVQNWSIRYSEESVSLSRAPVKRGRLF